MGAPESECPVHRPHGAGKTLPACALAHKACRDGFSVLHKRTTKLLRELAVAHVDGSIGRVLLKFSRVDVLVLDDFAMAQLKGGERRDFLEICDDRYQRRSLILTSQMPIAHWLIQVIGCPAVYDNLHKKSPAGLRRRIGWTCARPFAGGLSMGEGESIL
jgi:hypothetical protein